MGNADEDADATWTDAGTDIQLMAPPPPAAERYNPEGTLGTGGVGVVALHLDRYIGRRVATKRLRPRLADDPQIRARFLREAQVQGQLEHPAVVPVYDLGTDPDGTPFFTMKNVQGVTLAQILDELRDGEPVAERKYTRHRLLNAFAGVCLAIDYAHQRGVLHRDLKPANLMLGDYGEVYVLDWGLAKIRGLPDGPAASLTAYPEPLSGDRLSTPVTPDPGAVTHAGALLGTPGYLAPEQALDASAVGPEADVYSLGAILFELLTLEPLHPHASTLALLEQIQHPIEARPSVRAPDRDVAPELDAVCADATALEPAARTRTPRALHDAVQRYLEGAHDLEVRRDKAALHAAQAAQAAQRVLSGGAGTLDDRRQAMREIGRALALDPGNPRAVSTLVTLLTEPPAQTPPEVEYELDKAYRRDSRWVGGVGAVVYPAVLGFLPLMAWMGIRQPVVVLVCFALLLTAAGLSLLVSRAKVPPIGAILGSMVCSTIAFAMCSRFVSPLMIMPTALAVNAASYAIFLPRGYRRLVATVACLGVLAPFAIEGLGLAARTFVIEHDRVVILPRGLGLASTPTLVMVLIASVAAIVTGTILVGHIRDRLAAAERRMYLYTWHLREFVPQEARSATDPTSTGRRPNIRRR